MKRRVVCIAVSCLLPVVRRGHDTVAVGIGSRALRKLDVLKVRRGEGEVAGVLARLKCRGKMSGSLEPHTRGVRRAEAHARERAVPGGQIRRGPSVWKFGQTYPICR